MIAVLAGAVTASPAVSPPPASITSRVLAIDGSPFVALPSKDGKTVFVSVSNGDPKKNGILVIHRTAGGYRTGALVPLAGHPFGLALTPDERSLLVADGNGLAVLDAAAVARDETPGAKRVADSQSAGAIEVVATSDGRTAFVSAEGAANVAVVALDDAGPRITGHVPVDRAPVGLALTPDGATLFVTSEIAPDAPPCERRPRAHGGTLRAIDVATARSDATHASVDRTFAGCSPVRVAVSPDGDLAWVTARGDDRLLAFDAARVRAGSDDALRATVDVGRAPVGLALIDDGARAVVADSDRFGTGTAPSSIEIVDTKLALSGKSVVHSVPSGTFPRELRLASDGRVYLTDYASHDVRIFDESELSAL